MKLVFSFLLSIATIIPLKAQVIINEIQANNLNSVIDPDYGEYPDWVEIYNSGDQQIDLTNWSLNDQPNPNSSWQFPKGSVMQKGDFLLVWLDNKNVGFHANFRLNAAGESIYLFNHKGNIIDSISFEEQQLNVSFGRLSQNPNSWGYFPSPTPWEINNTPYIPQSTGKITFSHEEGFYNESFELSMSSETPGAIIKYTTDGSPPTNSSRTYQAPIDILFPTVIRAAEMVNSLIPDKDQSKIFIVNQPPSGLPVISLTVDPINLWDDIHGIYVTGTNGIKGNGPSTDPARNWNQDWEKPTLMTFFDENGEIKIKQKVGIKIFGGWSRAFNQKSLSIFARKRYGKGSLDYQFFKDKSIYKFESIILRNSGNDWAGSGGTMMRDATLQAIGAGVMNLDYQAYQPAEVYINGEYWGIHNIREKLNEHYAADNHQEDRDAIDLLEGNGSANSGSNQAYFQMIDWLENHNLSTKQNYQQVAEMIDIDNFIDYQILQIYVDNRDWPGNNIKFWRPWREEGKWRWILFDTDFGFGIWGQSPSDNTINFAREPYNTTWPNPAWSTFLFRKMLENNDFKLIFAKRFNHHLHTTFQPDRVISIIDSIEARIQPAIARHLERWGQNESAWERQVNTMRIYAEARPQYVKQHLQSSFNFSEPINHIVRVPDSIEGYVTLDTERQNQDFQGSWYPQTPSTLSAIPVKGKAFSHWVVGDVNTATFIQAGANWTYWDEAQNPTGDWTSPSFDDSNWKNGNAKLGYGEGDENTEINFGGDPSDKTPSALFRKEFSIQDKDKFSAFTIRLLRDDGAMVYLNGQEVIRSNMPSGTIERSTFAIESTFDGAENIYYRFEIDPSAFIEGLNTISVSVHQISPESSDLSFDLSLSATESEDNPKDVSIQDLTLPLSTESLIYPVFTNAKPVISEILYNPSSNQQAFFVEICNPALQTFDLSSYQISGLNFTFPQGTELLPNECLVITQAPSFYQNQGYQVFKADSGSLGAEGQLILLQNDLGEILDSVDYVNINPWPEVTNPGTSIELTQLHKDNANGENWGLSTQTGGSPGIFAAKSIFQGLWINEVMSDNTSNFTDPEKQSEDWIEIYNQNDFPINLGGMYLTDRKSNVFKWQIPVDQGVKTMIPSKGYFMLHADKDIDDGPNHINFAISNEGEFLALIDPDGFFVDSLTIPELGANQSFGREVDASTTLILFDSTSTTPKRSNKGRNYPPEITSTPVIEIPPNQYYTYAVTTMDENPESVRISAECLPQWLLLTDYQDGSGRITGDIKPEHIGEYRIILKAEDAFFNSYTSQEYILKVSNPIEDEISTTTTGIVYPNPSTGIFNYAYATPNESNVLIEIIDLNGKSLWAEKYISAGEFFRANIDISHLSSGMYIMRLYVDEELSATHKVIKN